MQKNNGPPKGGFSVIILLWSTKTKGKQMDEQYFYQVTREIAEIEDTNSYLQRVAEEMIQEKIQQEYEDWINSILALDFKGIAEKYADAFVW
jgi:hypothetical protein